MKPGQRHFASLNLPLLASLLAHTVLLLVAGRLVPGQAAPDSVLVVEYLEQSVKTAGSEQGNTKLAYPRRIESTVPRMADRHDAAAVTPGSAPRELAKGAGAPALNSSSRPAPAARAHFAPSAPLPAASSSPSAVQRMKTSVGSPGGPARQAGTGGVSGSGRVHDVPLDSGNAGAGSTSNAGGVDNSAAVVSGPSSGALRQGRGVPGPGARAGNAPPAASGASAVRRGAYQAQLKSLIEAHKQYPLAARKSGREGSCERRFVLGRDGSLRKVESLSSCGHPFLDAAATHAITAVGTFPPLPEEFHRAEEAFTITITFNLAQNR